MRRHKELGGGITASNDPDGMAANDAYQSKRTHQERPTLNGGEATYQEPLKAGDHVRKDGYPGVVVRRYSEGMVEVRLERGLVCVPDEDLVRG